MCPKATFTQSSRASAVAGARPDVQAEAGLCLRKRLSSLCRGIQFPLQCCCYGPCQDGSGEATKPAAPVPADACLRALQCMCCVILKSSCSMLADSCTEVGAVAPGGKADFSVVASVAVAQCGDLLCPV